MTEGQGSAAAASDEEEAAVAAAIARMAEIVKGFGDLVRDDDDALVVTGAIGNIVALNTLDLFAAGKFHIAIKMMALITSQYRDALATAAGDVIESKSGTQH